MNHFPSTAWTERAPFGALAFDLDGTLLSPRAQLEEGTIALLRQAAKTIPVHIVTGRMEAAARRFWRTLELDTPLVSCNGANIAVPGQPPLHRDTLPRETVRRLHALARDRDWHENFYVDDELLILRDGSRAQWYSEHFGVPARVVDEATLLQGPEPLKMLLILGPDEVAAALDEVTALFTPEMAHVTASSGVFVEFMPPGCNKGAALRRLAAGSGIPVERWVAVGDGLNDREMLATAGLGVAIASGDECLRREADWVVPPLWLSGLAELLDRAFHYPHAQRTPSYGESMSPFWSWLPAPPHR